ncbi:MAG: hypothetical protein VZQ98_02015 [Bacteroidales bacterium]|nr:hypothetical protein [Bacteroidales bacterium]
MRKIITTIVIALFSVVAYSQKDVTKFLGIPVDGTKTEMKQKLIAKGFQPVAGQEYLKGEFNGNDVRIYIGTNNNKVYRIMVCDVNLLNEADIIVRFNNLIGQFEKNERYFNITENERIKTGEDISYEMDINNKRYEAAFYQSVDTTQMSDKIRDMILKKYNYTNEQFNSLGQEQKEKILNNAFSMTMDYLCKKTVWFMISETHGWYYITMYYDNNENKANGEDL